MQEEFNLTPEEEEAFKNLDKYKLPKASLENKIITQLKNENLIMEKKPKLTYTIAIVASVVIVAIVGWAMFSDGINPEGEGDTAPHPVFSRHGL